MKLMKYILALAIAVCAVATNSHGQGSAVLVAGGSSALFLELGQAAFGIAGQGCVWTAKSASTVEALDDRTSPATAETGSYWVTWGKGTGTCAVPAGAFSVYSYLQLDSVIGDRCYFLVNSSSLSGCQMSVTVAAGTAGINLLGAGFTDTAIPSSVISAVNGHRFNAAGTDIRPEDAKFASKRMFTACGTTLTREPFGISTYSTAGLGYQTATTGVGTTVLSFYSAKNFHVLDFNISGTDPISGKAVRTYTVSVVGAQPIIVVVGPAGSGIGTATDINSATLAKFLDGTLGRSTDLIGAGSTVPVTTLVREALSGTYNTMEFSVPNTVEFRTSQDAGNCSGTVVKSNPMNIASANGKSGFRRRVIGTGEMITEIQGATTSENRLGYFFWSAGNGSSFTSSNGRYLTLNGVDPLVNSYSVTNGVIPTGAGLSNITFAGLNDGDYSAWSALRIVSTSPTPAAVTNLIAAAQVLNSTQHDFVTLANLKVWHAHFTISSIGITSAANGPTLNTTGDLCGTAGALAEAGGDAGGATINKAANHDYCSDFSSTTGILNQNN